MIKLEKILLPIDFSKHSKDAVQAALAIRRDFGAKIIAINIFDINELLGMGWTIYGEAIEGEAIRRMETDSSGALLKFAEENGLKGEGVELLVKKGKTFIEIIKTAKEEKIDLIVMGTHGRKGIEHLLLGSNAEKIIRKAPCSVLTLRHLKDKTANPFPPSKILMPTDFSLTSERAMNMAVELARQYKSKITLLHVFPDFKVQEEVQWTSYVVTPHSEAEIREEIAKKAQKELEAFIEKFPIGDLQVETRVIDDFADKGIVAVAAEENAELIVMGTHGRSGLTHLLMGSVAEKVVKTAPCPVLTVKPGTFTFEMP